MTYTSTTRRGDLMSPVFWLKLYRATERSPLLLTNIFFKNLIREIKAIRGYLIIIFRKMKKPV
jgi:hypothetical protein